MKKIVILMILPVLLSCGSDDGPVSCTEEFVFGLNVTVIDTSTGNELIENVQVSAVDGNYTEILEQEDTYFLGAGERPGSYFVTAVADGYQTNTQGPVVVELTNDQCHVIPESIALFLEPI